jgi:hypothetical protein
MSVTNNPAPVVGIAGAQMMAEGAIGVADAPPIATARRPARAGHEARRRRHVAGIFSSPAVWGFVGVAVVERRPWLAARAAWAMLADGQAARPGPVRAVGH